MITVPLALSFRGQRDYIHGTDLFASIHAAFLQKLKTETLTKIRFKIPRFFNSPLRLRIHEGVDKTAVFQTVVNDKTYSGTVFADPAASPLDRRPFVETRDHMHLTQTAASFTRPSGWSAIEDVVFLGKYLNIERRAPGNDKQWVFTQLELAQSLREGASSRVEFSSALGEFYTKSSLLADDKPVGAIYFALIDCATRTMERLHV